MSDHKTLKRPSLWIPERNLRLLAAIGKLGEESAELNRIISRITIQGINGQDPETGKPNRSALAEEIADVHGLSRLVVDELGLDFASIKERATAKLEHKRLWLDMITVWQTAESGKENTVK